MKKIEMTPEDFKRYMRQLLRSWEYYHGRIHAPSDVVKLNQFSDDHYEGIYLEAKNDLID